MKPGKPKNKPFEVSYEYEPTPDAEGRIVRVYEFLLSDERQNTLRNNSAKIEHFQGR